MEEIPNARRMDRDPGKSYTRVEEEVGRILWTTYQFEKARYERSISAGTSAVKLKFNDVFKVRTVTAGAEQESSVVDADSKKLNSVLNVARACIKKGVDAEKFVKYRFFTHPPGSPVPHFSSFLSNEALSKYLKAQVSDEDKYELRLALQINNETFSSAVVMLTVSPLSLTREQIWARVLLDDKIEMSALFRYCTAVGISCEPDTVDPERFGAVAAEFKTQAAIQYMSAAEAYSAAWGDFIPVGFSKLAKVVYLHTLGQRAEEFENGEQ